MAGTLTGPGRITEAGQTLTLATNTDRYLQASSLRNRGTVIFSGGTLNVIGTSAVLNDAGAVWDAQGTRQIASNFSAGGNTFTNAGTLRNTGAFGAERRRRADLVRQQRHDRAAYRRRCSGGVRSPACRQRVRDGRDALRRARQRLRPGGHRRLLHPYVRFADRDLRRHRRERSSVRAVLWRDDVAARPSPRTRCSAPRRNRSGIKSDRLPAASARD